MHDETPATSGPAAAEPAAALLFVYGTLKRGGANHGWMQGQVFLGPARTAPGLTLYSLGEYPGMAPDPADGLGVTGELWAVEAAALARLDEFEGVPQGLYAREPVRLVDYPRHLPRTLVARAQAYRYLKKVDPRARLGDTWPIAPAA